MKTIRDFKPMTDRYSFDVGACSYANGFAQIDTRQDAAHFGSWTSHLLPAGSSTSARAT